MSALWVVSLLVLCQGPVPVVRADEGAAPVLPGTFLPGEAPVSQAPLNDLFGPTLFDWYGELSIIYLDRTMPRMDFGTMLGGVQSLGAGSAFADLTTSDNRAVSTNDMSMGPQPGLRFLVGRTIWADPCDDRGCVAKPVNASDSMRRLSVELGYLGMLQEHQASVRYQANPAAPNGAITSRFVGTGVSDVYLPQLWPFDYANLNTLSYRSRFDSAELNLRYSTQASHRMPIDVLAGVRYMKLQENLDFFAANNSPHLPGLMNASPYGNYSTRTDNDLIGLQIGGDLSYRLTSDWSLMGRGRGGLLVNSASQRSNLSGTLVSTSLPYSDSGTASGVGVASLFEFGIHTNYQLSSNLSLQLGYQGLFLSDLSTAPRQFQWGLEQGSRNTLDRTGSLFFFGPAAGIEWKW
ncbi:MAG: Lpg1974 family pore-forming outer membrane protein [Gemmatales bacterium]